MDKIREKVKETLQKCDTNNFYDIFKDNFYNEFEQFFLKEGPSFFFKDEQKELWENYGDLLIFIVVSLNKYLKKYHPEHTRFHFIKDEKTYETIARKLNKCIKELGKEDEQIEKRKEYYKSIADQQKTISKDKRHIAKFLTFLEDEETILFRAGKNELSDQDYTKMLSKMEKLKKYVEIIQDKLKEKRMTSAKKRGRPKKQ